MRVVITIKGNNAGKTLYAQIVIPSKKLRIYFAGAEMNTATIQIDKAVVVHFKCFTNIFYLIKYQL